MTFMTIILPSAIKSAIVLLCLYIILTGLWWVKYTYHLHEEYMNLSHCKSFNLRDRNRIVDERCRESEGIVENPFDLYSIYLFTIDFLKHNISFYGKFYLGFQVIMFLLSPFILVKTLPTVLSPEHIKDLKFH